MHGESRVFEWKLMENFDDFYAQIINYKHLDLVDKINLGKLN